MTHHGREAVAEGGGLLLDEFASCAVTRSAPVGGLDHLPGALLAQPSVPQILFKLLLGHQNSVLP